MRVAVDDAEGTETTQSHIKIGHKDHEGEQNDRTRQALTVSARDEKIVLRAGMLYQR